MEPKIDIGLLTSSQFPELQKDYQPLIDQFDSMGLVAKPILWNDDQVKWENIKNLIFCSAWDYHQDYSKFNHWLSQVEKISNVINSPAIVRWNIDKTYLQHFEKHSIPVIETFWVGQNGNKIDNLESHFDTEHVVAKPAIGAGSSGMKRFNLSTQKGELQTHINNISKNSKVMVQPYLESADLKGETALVYLGGKFSHAVLRPIAGHKGTPDEEVASASYVEPTQNQSQIGDKVIDCLPFEPAYLRVDLIEGIDKSDVVLEAEMIEPTLFFEQYPQSISNYATILKDSHLR